jgi:hypothetical protein
LEKKDLLKVKEKYKALNLEGPHEEQPQPSEPKSAEKVYYAFMDSCIHAFLIRKGKRIIPKHQF